MKKNDKENQDKLGCCPCCFSAYKKYINIKTSDKTK